jgi:hypothetical protein
MSFSLPLWSQQPIQEITLKLQPEGQWQFQTPTLTKGIIVPYDSFSN